MTSLAVSLTVTSIAAALFSVWALGEIRDALRRSRHSQQITGQIRPMWLRTRAVNIAKGMDR